MTSSLGEIRIAKIAKTRASLMVALALGTGAESKPRTASGILGESITRIKLFE
jgi:hypothetical protein